MVKYFSVYIVVLKSFRQYVPFVQPY